MDVKTNAVCCANEQELRDTLTNLFKETGTRLIVRSLLLQVKEWKGRTL